MKIFLCMALAGLCLWSCVDQEAASREYAERSQANLDSFARKQTEQVRELEKYNSPTEKTASDEAEASRLAQIYYDGLAHSIMTLDDGTSDAVTIARAAVSENREKLISWKRGMMIHWYRKPQFRAKIDANLNDLPSENQVNEATSVVLRLRSKKSAGI